MHRTDKYLQQSMGRQRGTIDYNPQPAPADTTKLPLKSYVGIIISGEQ